MNVGRAATTDEVFEGSDFVSLHVPRTPQTMGLVNEESLDKMKPTAYLINVARGGIVDETDLYNALKSGVIGGAALDVFAEEPTTESPIFALPNVVVTPHLGASTAEAQDRAGITAAEQVAAALKGQVPIHAINAPVPVGEGAEFVAQFAGLCEVLGSLLYQLTDRPGASYYMVQHTTRQRRPAGLDVPKELFGDGVIKHAEWGGAYGRLIVVDQCTGYLVEFHVAVVVDEGMLGREAALAACLELERA